MTLFALSRDQNDDPEDAARLVVSMICGFVSGKPRHDNTHAARFAVLRPALGRG
ncbi:MAG: hypothetical protein JSS43_27520 [Proteobacteria bacterium]|nr:hypothetical protein [Pseudomonadota bacterium]